jgi:hypothetical protein
MEKRKTILGSDTLIPIGAVSVVFGACIWLTTIWAQGNANAMSIAEVKVQREKDVDKLDQRLERIDNKLEEIRKELKNGNGRR